MNGQHRVRSARRRGSVVVGALLAASALLLGGLTAAPASALVTTPEPVPTGTRPSSPPLPTRSVRVIVTPSSGSVVGIAYPLTAKFTSPVRFRAAAEHHMHVYVNGVFAQGAWFWRDSRTAVYRLKGFWPGHAAVTLRLTLGGVELDRTATYSIVGASTTTRTHVLRVARALVAKVSATTHRMLVYRDGVLVRNFGVSLGKAGFETRSGFKAVMEKYATRNMTSQELGLTNEFYDLWAPWSTRITPTGEFVHGAPWAAGRIGRWNGSHGCTNLFTNDAKWFYDNTIRGDLVITYGTGRAMEYWNGIGAPYNMPWTLWLRGSALKGAF